MLAEMVRSVGLKSQQINASYNTAAGRVLRSKKGAHLLVLREPRNTVISLTRVNNSIYHPSQLKNTINGFYRNNQPVSDYITQFMLMASDPNITVLFYDNLVRTNLASESDTFFTGEGSDYLDVKWGWEEYGAQHWEEQGGTELDELYQSIRRENI